MIILKPITDLQEVRFIPTRKGDGNNAIITSETTNVSESITLRFQIRCSECAFYQQFEHEFDFLKEAQFYSISIYEDDNLIHRDKIYCTAQDTDNYSVNNGTYIAKQDNIIFYE